MKKQLLTLVALSLTVVFSHAQTKQWLRHTAIAPDGSQIAFTAKGDIYLVPVTGGKAQRLTTNAAYDTKPVWSNDGSKIAFASDRHGNFDVFVINISGGAAQRLTYHSSSDMPSSFTTDDQNILFNSRRLDNRESMLHPDHGELYSVDLNASMPKQVLSIPAYETQINQAGELLFEEIKGGEDEFRKHHTSSVTRDIWIKKASGEFQKLSAFEGEDRDPVFGQNGSIFYLSEKNGTQNVFQSTLANPEITTQISNLSDHPVRYLSIANTGLLCYNFNGGIYTQTPGQDPVALSVDISGDESIAQNNLLFVSGGVTEMVPSPNGKEIAFIFRGDVFVTTVEGSFTRRLTNTPEQERSIDISKDGRSIVYAGERNNSWNLYLQKIPKKEEKYFVNALDLTEETLLASNAETFQPTFSPDGKKVAFLEERTALKTIDIATKQVVGIHNGQYNFSYADGDQSYTWSPDGKWFLISYYPQQYWVDEIGLVSSDGSGTIRNLSKSGFYDLSPKWTKDGSMIYWESNRDGMKSVANTGRFTTDIFGLFLTQNAYDEFNMSKTEFALFDPKEDNEDKKEDKDSKKKKKGTDEKEDKEEVKPVKFEFDGMADRKRKLSLFSANVADFVITHDKKHLFVLSRVERKYELWKIDLRTKETKSISTFNGYGRMELDSKGEKLFILSRGSISYIEVKSGKKKSVSIDGEMNFDLTAERKYLIEHVARQVEKKFLDPELHGAPWEMMTNNYKQFIDGINNDYDFEAVLSELLGELNASHTGARYWYSTRKGDNTASLGAFYDADYSGAGVRINEIMPKSPLINGDRKIKPGVIIEAINDQSIAAGANFYRFLNRKAGKMTIISFYDPTTGARWKERIKPVRWGAEREMLYQRWMKRNREMVHQLSNNQIGYVHVRSMSDGSYREFLDKVMGEEHNKKALVVDTRYNGGGDLVDDISMFLTGEKYMDFQTRDKKILGYESQRRWTKPSIMLVCEDNYSDAHCTPAAYKDLEIGKIVGMPVPGTCSFVWWERMQNGMVFGIPNMQVLDKVGDVLENKQLEPDFEVKNDFDKVVAGQDQQIAKAVEELLKEIE